jgi:hypothetical protein
MTQDPLLRWKKIKAMIIKYQLIKKESKNTLIIKLWAAAA